MGNEQAGGEHDYEGHEHHLRFAEQVFTKREQARLMKRYLKIASGRDHISKEDFLSQPELGCNPLISRVVDVVLEENGHAVRRDFEGQEILADFGTGERERDIGIHFDPAAMVGPKNKKAQGAIIEEVVPGGVGAMKGNLHSGMRLLSIHRADDPRGHFVNLMGLPYKQVTKIVGKAKRPMTLKFQDPEPKTVHDDYLKALIAVDKSYGATGHKDRSKHKLGGASKGDDGDGSDSDSDDEAEAEQKKKQEALRPEYRTRRYEVEFTNKGSYGLKLEANPEGIEYDNEEGGGTHVVLIQPGSFADNCGKIKAGHFLVAIGKKDATHMKYDNVMRALRKAKRPVTLGFMVKTKVKKKKNQSLEGEGSMHGEDMRPSHVFMQRQYLNHQHVTFEDFLNVLSVCSSKLAHETELQKRIVFRIYDVDNDGFVGQDDLFYMFKFVTHSRLSDAQLEVMVDAAFVKLDGGPDGDRKVNPQEFAAYMGNSSAHEFLEVDF